MRLRDDDRAASVQIGAVLLFAMLIVAVAGWQAQVVPADNAEVEYTHSQRVGDDMQDVRNEIVSAPGRSSLRSISVEMAPSYPPRTIFVNPGPPDGTLRTVGTTDRRLNLTVDNAEATDDEAADYWDGSARAYDTGGLRYEPGYNVYTGAPDTVYENTVLYDAHDDGTTVTVAGQDLVEGRTLSLVTVNGSLTRTTGGTYSVDLKALSSSSRTVSVTGSGGNVTVSFASSRPPAWWEQRLRDAGEFTDQGGYVYDVRSGSPATVGQFRNVTVEMAAGETYRLEMAKVGVGSGTEESGKTYAVDVEGDGSRISTGDTQRLVVEVRDAYNNPVSGVTVANNTTGTDLNGGSLDAEAKTTGDDGRVTFEFTGGSSGTATIQFNVSDDATPLASELVTFTVEVGGSGGDTTGPGTTNVATNTTTVEQGGEFDLTADASDVGRGGSDIYDAEWWSNRSTPGGSSGNGFALQPSDGEFNQAEEGVENLSIDTTGWSTGFHELSVRSRDANANWGASTGTVIEVTPPVIDNFEDGTIDEYAGDTNKFTTVTGPTYDGTYALQGSNNGNTARTITSTGGLDAYPGQGDTVSAKVRLPAGSPAASTRFYFGQTSGGANYYVQLDQQVDGSYTITLDGNTNTGTSSRFTLSTDTWYTVRIVWDSASITAEVVDPGGTTLGSASITEEGDGGNLVGFDVVSGDVLWDYAKKE